MPGTILMIHGMWGGAWCWELYKGFFEERGYTCVTPTLRHHDADPRDPPDPRLATLSLLDYARDLETLIQGLGDEPILMGHSMGGLLAQILGSRGLGRALVLLTPASPRGILALQPTVIRSFRSVLFRWGFWRRPHRLPFEDAVYALLHRVPPEQRRSAYDRFVHESGRAAAEIGFWLFDPRRAAEVDASRVNLPILVVAGAEDHTTPASVVRQVADRYGGLATFRVFPDHAHWVLAEPGWEEIAGYAYGWLAERAL